MPKLGSLATALIAPGCKSHHPVSCPGFYAVANLVAMAEALTARSAGTAPTTRCSINPNAYSALSEASRSPPAQCPKRPANVRSEGPQGVGIKSGQTQGIRSEVVLQRCPPGFGTARHMNHPSTTASQTVSLHVGAFMLCRIHNGSCMCSAHKALHDGSCMDCSDMKLDRAASVALHGPPKCARYWPINAFLMAQTPLLADFGGPSTRKVCLEFDLPFLIALMIDLAQPRRIKTGRPSCVVGLFCCSGCVAHESTGAARPRARAVSFDPKYVGPNSTRL